MAVTTATLTGKITDIIGSQLDDLDAAVVTLETNSPRGLTDLAGNRWMLGTKPVPVAADGTINLTGVVKTNSPDIKPWDTEDGLYRLKVEYRDLRDPKAQRGRVTVTTGWFELTENNATLASKVSGLEVTVVTATTVAGIGEQVAAAQAAAATATGAVTAAEDVRAEVEDLRDQAATITEPLTAPANNQVASYVAQPGPTKEALTASIAQTAAPRAGLNVKDPAFGAKGDGTTNDGAAIQAAIDAARDAVRAGFALGAGMAVIPGGRYRTTQRIVQPPYVKVIPLAPVVVLSEVPGDSAWHITPLADDPTELYPGVLNKQQWMMGDLIDGSHGGITIANNDPGGAGTTIGLELGPRTDLTASRPLSRYTLGHIAIKGFAEGLRWQARHHYIAHYTALKIESNDVAVHVVGPGTNSGENITFADSLFASTTGTNPGILVESPNIDLNFRDCSADFLNTVCKITRGWGSFNWQGGHLEGTNEASRYSADGGVVVVTAAASEARPTVTIGPRVPLVSTRRGIRFRGNMFLTLDAVYRVASDYTSNQAPGDSMLCDADVRVVRYSLVLTRGGPLMRRTFNLVRDASLTTDAIGTAGTALTHWARSGGGTITAVTDADAPLAGSNSIKATLGASSYLRFTAKAFAPCRPGETIYGTFAYKFMGAPSPNQHVGALWYDSEKVQIGTETSVQLTRTVTTDGEWRVPDGPVPLDPPEGAVFCKLFFQISHSAGTGTVDYYFGDPQFHRRAT